jgi:hypothetical protein
VPIFSVSHNQFEETHTCTPVQWAGDFLWVSPPWLAASFIFPSLPFPRLLNGVSRARIESFVYDGRRNVIRVFTIKPRLPRFVSIQRHGVASVFDRCRINAVTLSRAVSGCCWRRGYATGADYLRVKFTRKTPYFLISIKTPSGPPLTNRIVAP